MASRPGVRVLKAVRALRGSLFRLRPGVTTKGLPLVGGGCLFHRAPGASLRLGAHVEFLGSAGLYLDAPGAVVEIGDRTYLNRRTEIHCQQSVRIGADCAIAWDVQISDCDYHQIDGRPSVAAVTIGDRVWIGQRVVITKGVTIGDGAVIAAGAVVHRDVAPGSLVGGVPATVLRPHVDWR